MKTKLYYIIFLFVACCIQAQNPVSIQLTEKDGLPDYEIYDLIEDHQGYIWIAANKGLFRYDGKNFLHFNHEDKRGLSVFGLQLDNKGRVWCNNISGQLFFIADGKMHLFLDIKENINGKLPDYILDKNNLFILTENGLIKFDLDTKAKTILKDSSIESSIYHSPFYFKNKLHLLHGFNLLELDGNTFSVLKKFNSFIPTGNAKIIPIQLKEEILVAIVSSEVTFQRYAEGKWHEFPTPVELQKLKINELFFQNDELWIATNKGVFVYQLSSKQLLFKRIIIKGENCTKVLKDKNQNYWFSTLEKGIFVVPNVNIIKSNTLVNEKITDFDYFDKNNLLFGTMNGKIGWISCESFHATFFDLPTDSKVVKIVYDSYRNQVYISQENNAYVWKLKQNTLFKAPQLALAKSLTVREDELIYGTYNKALKYTFIEKTNKDTLKTPIKHIPKMAKDSVFFISSEIRDKRTYTISSNPNNYWIGYVDDLYFYSKENQIAKIEFENKSIFAVDLFADSSSIAWVSTFEKGLLQINKKKIKSFTTNNGLLSNYLGKIQNDNSYLWILSDKGIQRLDKKTFQFTNLLKSDGLETYDYYDFQAVGDYLFLSSNKGIYRIHKNNCFKSNPTPDVFITNIEVNGITEMLKDKYELDFDKSSIKIAFNVTGFQKESYVDYEYRLLPNEKKWQLIDNGLNFLRYNSLSVGDYTFEIRAKSKNGIPSKKQTILLHVHAPFWQKWWFYAALALFALVVSGTYLYLQNRKKAKEQNLLMEKAKTERELLYTQLENLRSQMNPHFIFNALNSIQEYIITNEKDMASTYLVKFSRLIRMYLDHSRSQEVVLKDEVQALQLYLDLEKIRFEETLEFQIDIDPKLLNQPFYVPSLFIQPYVENAIKHGLLHKQNNRKLTIQFYQKKTSLFCEVQDNGVGRVAAQRIKKLRMDNHQSFATSANEHRVTLLNKMRKNKIKVSILDLYMDSENATGTKVVIEIPIDLYESNNN